MFISKAGEAEQAMHACACERGDNEAWRSLYGGLAQLGEHLLCKQGVIGSIPLASTNSRECACCAQSLGL